MTHKLITLSAIFATSACLLTGCKDFEPVDTSFDTDVPRGPGIFTGEKGYYEINLD